jgi:CubicO group peptidase (beta-lactamase class C family)
VANGYSYGYGFLDGMDAGVRVVGHGGGAPGMSGELIMIPSRGYVIVVLSNLDPPIATDAAYYIARHLPP